MIEVTTFSLPYSEVQLIVLANIATMSAERPVSHVNYHTIPSYIVYPFMWVCNIRLVFILYHRACLSLT